jgi:hypothetical protein
MASKLVYVAGAALALGLLAAGASAQPLYKLIDRNGKVTYSEKPPKDFDGQVIRLDIDPKANTATLPKPGAPASEAISASRASDDRVRAAKEKLESARKAYEKARDNPRDEDLTFIGNKGGGTRPVPSEEYSKKLQALEQAVKDAEEEVKRAERG